MCEKMTNARAQMNAQLARVRSATVAPCLLARTRSDDERRRRAAADATTAAEAQRQAALAAELAVTQAELAAIEEEMSSLQLEFSTLESQLQAFNSQYLRQFGEKFLYLDELKAKNVDPQRTCWRLRGQGCCCAGRAQGVPGGRLSERRNRGFPSWDPAVGLRTN